MIDFLSDTGAVAQAIFSLSFWTFVLNFAGVYTIFALGLQLQYGYTGLLNFGHVGFMAIGAYTMAILSIEASWPLWASAPVAIVVSMAFGLLVGLPTLRLRSDYLAITTIAFSEIIRLTILNWQSVTRGPQGIFGAWRDYTGFASSISDRVGFLNGDRVLFILVWVTAGVLALVLRRLLRSPWGRVLRAIREDEDAAAALGKNPLRYKLQVMAIGSGIAAIAGFMFSFQFLFISPDSFEPLFTFFGWVIILLGGTAKLAGVPVGAILFAVIFAGTRFFGFWPLSLLSSSQRGAMRLIIIGVILIALMAFRPQGIFGKREELLLER